MAEVSLVPNLINFGLPTVPEPLEAEDVVEGAEFGDEPEPLGFDFTWEDGDLKLDASGDLFLMDQHGALKQWCAAALLTFRGTDIVYPNNFGADTHELIAAGIPGDVIAEDLGAEFSEVVTFHDRIEGLEDIIAYWDPDSNVITMTAQVVLDDEERLEVEAGPLTFNA